MELDELKQAWVELGRRQAGMETLLHADFRNRRKDKMRSILGWSLAARAVELTLWITFTACAATFWVSHRDVLHWLVIGLLLHIYGIAGIWVSATQLLLLSRIYLFDAPVVVLQRRLAQLRQLDVWCTLALGLPCGGCGCGFRWSPCTGRPAWTGLRQRRLGYGAAQQRVSSAWPSVCGWRGASLRARITHRSSSASLAT